MGFLEEPKKNTEDSKVLQLLVDVTSKNFQHMANILNNHESALAFQKILNIILVVGFAVLTFNVMN